MWVCDWRCGFQRERRTRSRCDTAGRLFAEVADRPCWLNVATAEVAQDFVAFLRAIDASVEAELDLHVILDDLSAHEAPAVHRWLLRHPWVHFHFTPMYASWLNLVERFFGLLTEEPSSADEHPATLGGDIWPASLRTTTEGNRSPGPRRLMTTIMDPGDES